MYSKETLEKYLQDMQKTIAWYAMFPVESLEICISDGNRKVPCKNVSLPPIISCHNCKECKKECYDIKACIQYKDVMKARARNYSILKRNFDLYWQQIRSKVSRMKKKYFRFHVGGDMVSKEYLTEMIKTAKMFPNVRFWTYTKFHSVVNEYVKENGGSKEKAIPSNLSIMFSEWEGMETINPYGFGTFIVVDKGQTPPKGVWQCTGDCGLCIKMNRGCVINETSWVWKH